MGGGCVRVLLPDLTRVGVGATFSLAAAAEKG